ncbi:uncharacterized protein [Drosophila bipectinata]|uniref:uncharacterized protein n=1 Tax=Drosophila bipectinata TaxID=42026 RepID=UPI001C8A906F|nr:uncharacterized protein LOC108125298 [Drosophila bipectinata]
MRNRKRQIMQLLENMGSAQEEIVSRATEELQKKCNDATSTVFICTVMRSNDVVKMRQNAATILALRLAKAEVWQQLTEQQSATIMTDLFESLKSLEYDGDKQLQGSVVRNLGLAMAQERGSWTEAVFDYIEATCLSEDVERRHLGSIIFSSLPDASSEVFVNQMERAQRIFLDGLQLAHDTGNLVSPITDCLSVGWLQALIAGHSHFQIGDKFSSSMPLLMRFCRLCPNHPNKVKCVRGFLLIGSLHYYKPAFFWKHSGMISDTMMALATDINLPMPMRVEALKMLRELVLEKLSEISKLKLMDNFLMTLHRVLAVEPIFDSDGDEDYLGLCRRRPSTLVTGVATLKKLVKKSKSGKLVTRCLRLFTTYLDTKPKPLHRMAVYVFFGVMCEGFATAMRLKQMKGIFDLVKNGCNDEEPLVSKAAYFSLSKMLEGQLPGIAQLADRIMPVFYTYFEQDFDSCRVPFSGSHVDTRLFYSLELLLHHLRPSVLERYAPDLMSRLLQLFHLEDDWKNVRKMALSSIAGLCDVVGAGMESQFDAVVDATQPCLQLTGKDGLQVRGQAIRVFAVLARVSKEKFTNLAPMLLTMDVSFLEESDLPESYTFSLMTELCAVMPNECSGHVKLIVEAVFKTLSSFEIDLEKDKLEEQAVRMQDVRVRGYEDDYVDETDESEDDSDDDDDDDDSSLSSLTSNSSDSDVRDAREEAILCLKSLAIHVPDSLEPFKKEAVGRLEECLELNEENVSMVAFETLTQFVVIFWKKGNYAEATRLSTKIIGKAIPQMVKTFETKIVYTHIVSIRILLTELNDRALEKVSQGPKIFRFLKSIMRRRLNCLKDVVWSCNDEVSELKPNDPEYWCDMFKFENKLVHEALAILPILCKAMGAQRFSQLLEPLTRSCLSQYGCSAMEVYFCGVVITCLDVMEDTADPFYKPICRCISKNLRYRFDHVRRSCFKSLDAIVDYLDRKPDVILAMATSLVDVVRDCKGLTDMEMQSGLKVMCKMIIFDHNKCPVGDFLDLIFNHPTFIVGADLQGHDVVLLASALLILVDNQNEVFHPYTTKILEMFFKLLMKNQLDNEDKLQKAKNLITAIKQSRPEDFNAVALKYESVVAQLFP